MINQPARYEDCTFYFTLPMAAFFIALGGFRFKIYIDRAKCLRELSTWVYLSQFGFLQTYEKGLGFLGVHVNGFVIWGMVVASTFFSFVALNYFARNRGGIEKLI